MRSIPAKRIAILLLVLLGLTGCNQLVGRYYYLWGDRLYKDGKFSEAVTAFDGAIKNNYRVQECYAYRGIARFHLGQYDLAIDDNNAALAISTDYAPAYNGRGLAYYRKGEIDKAIDDMESVLKYSRDQKMTDAATKFLQVIRAKKATQAR